MSDPVPTPPAAPPPRVNWWRAALLAVGLAYLGCALVFPNDTFAFGHLAVLSLAPFALLLLSWWKWRGPANETSEAGRLRFRRFWTWVWLVAALASTALFAFGKGWRSDSGTALRLSLALLLLWTTLLLLAMWGVFRALGRREFWRAALRQSLFAAAVLATLIAIFYAEENWRGRRRWERFRAEWEAKGVKFSIAEVMPPPVPDDQNMAMHPLFKPVFDYTLGADGMPTWRDTNGMERLHRLTTHPPELWQLAAKTFPQSQWPVPSNSGSQNRTNGVVLANLAHWQDFYRLDTNFAATPPEANPALEVLRYLARHDTALAQLEEALARPHSQFPLKVENELPGSILLPHLANLKQITLLLTLRATARLEAGQPEAALRDVQSAWRLCESLEREPFVISQLVQISIQAITLGAVAHGTALHRWEDRHLRRLDELLRSANKLRSWEFSIRSEAAFMADQLSKMERSRALAEKAVASLEDVVGGHGERVLKNGRDINRWVVRFAPAGWYFQWWVREETVMLACLTPTFVDAERRRASWQNQPGIPPKLWFDRIWPLQNIEGTFTKTAAKCVRLQINLDHGRIACALERHWLRHRAYPERLDALVPEFLDRVPHDPFDGQPMRYRREGEQGFVLWSIGFDGKDDNAAPLLPKPSGTTHTGEETGDLVWRYPQAK